MSRVLRFLILGLILFSVFTVYWSTPEEEQFARQADEGYYFAYAKTIKEGGISQFPVLLEKYLNNETAKLFPHPGRAGHVLMTAFWFKIFPNNFSWLARFSFFCFVLFLIISFYFFKKFFGADIAYFSTMLLSSEPLIMASGRRALQDSSLNLFLSLSIWFFLDFLVNRKKATFILFTLIYSWAITIKESSIILTPFFILSYFLYKYKYKQNISRYYLYGLIFAPLLLVGGFYLFLFDGAQNLAPLADYLFGLRLSPLISDYCLFADGPWYTYIIGCLMLSPILALLAIGYFFYALLGRKYDWRVEYFMLYPTFILSVLGNLKYIKNVRFIINLETAVILLASLALYEFFTHKNNTYKFYLIFISAAAIYFLNYHNFLYLFCEKNIYDPINLLLLKAKGIIP